MNLISPSSSMFHHTSSFPQLSKILLSCHHLLLNFSKHVFLSLFFSGFLLLLRFQMGNLSHPHIQVQLVSLTFHCLHKLHVILLHLFVPSIFLKAFSNSMLKKVPEIASPCGEPICVSTVSRSWFPNLTDMVVFNNNSLHILCSSFGSNVSRSLRIWHISYAH